MPFFGGLLILIVLVGIGLGFVYLPDYIHKIRMQSRELQKADLEIETLEEKRTNEALRDLLEEEKKRKQKQKERE